VNNSLNVQSSTLNVQRSRCGRIGDRGTIARLVFIRRYLLAGGSTSDHLARMWECSRKTIYRDLHFMRDRLGYDLEFDSSTNNWRLLSAPKPVL